MRLAILFALVLAAPAPAADAFADLNAYRAANRLPKFTRDEGLSRAAEAAASFRAKHRLFGHTESDFKFLPAGASADAAGCAAYPAGYGIMACGLRDDHTHAGAAAVAGDDGKVYWHVFYRGGSGRELIRAEASVPAAPYVAKDTKPAPKAGCPCQAGGCPCAAGKPCSCGDYCSCPDCPGRYAAGYERVKKGEALKLAVGVKANKSQSEYQSPPMPGVRPGVYRWYAKDGVPTIDVAPMTAAPLCPTGRCPLQPGSNPFAPSR